MLLSNSKTTFLPLKNRYVAPLSRVFSLEAQDVLAASNTETIDEDEEEYDWGGK